MKARSLRIGLDPAFSVVLDGIFNPGVPGGR